MANYILNISDVVPIKYFISLIQSYQTNLNILKIDQSDNSVENLNSLPYLKI